MPEPETCRGCDGTSTDATHTCRAKGYPPVMTYGCDVQQIHGGDDEHREAMRQLLWAAYDRLQKGEV